MTPVQSNDDPPVEQDMAGRMAKYGITRVPVDYFHVGKYRYTRLEDAIAEAERRRPAVKV